MEKDNNINNFFNQPWLVIIALALGSFGVTTGTGIIPINQKEQQEVITAEEIGEIVAPIVSSAVRETMEAFYKEDENKEELKDFIHRIDGEHERCLLDYIDSGVSRVSAEVPCSLQRNSEILIRNLK